MSMVLHPATGEIWETENGPQGGDELNIIRAGGNYGWPVISYDRSVRRRRDRRHRSELAAAVGSRGWNSRSSCGRHRLRCPGMAFYTGDRFPQWKGNIFIGALVGEQVQLVVLNPRGLPTRRQALFTSSNRGFAKCARGPTGSCTC